MWSLPHLLVDGKQTKHEKHKHSAEVKHKRQRGDTVYQPYRIAQMVVQHGQPIDRLQYRFHAGLIIDLKLRDVPFKVKTKIVP